MRVCVLVVGLRLDELQGERDEFVWAGLASAPRVRPALHQHNGPAVEVEVDPLQMGRGR